jgi:hypothetical protein
MKIKPAAVALAALLTVFPSAITFAQTIQFGRHFQCNGERVAIDSCFDDGDNAHCMVMYPDRPLHNGFEVQMTALRGDVIKMIRSCVGPAATLASTGNPAPASAPGAASRPNAAAASPAGGPPPPPDPSVATARAAGVDMTVLGIPLGEAFALPHCQRGNDLVSQVDNMVNGDVDPAGLLDQNQPTPCYGANPTELQNGQSYAWMPVDTVIKFSDDKCPSWLSGCTAYGMLRNGLLLAIYMDPENGTGEDVTAKQLRAKYGKPTKENNQTFQNAYGVSVQVDQLFWELPGLHVEYSPLIAQTQRGMLRIETETGYQIRLAAQKAVEDKQPKL